MNAATVFDEVLKQMCHEVRGDGVHADNDQRKHDSAMLADIDEPGKCGKKEEHTPPLKSVHEGVQIFFTMGQISMK